MSGPACAFDPGHYKEILLHALDRGFRVLTCAELARDPHPDERVLVLRHDVDVELDAAFRMAEIERGVGVRASYFILAGSHMYDPRAPRHAACLRELAAAGFEIGLHYDLVAYSRLDTGLEQALQDERRLIESLIGAPVRGVAEHMPRRRWHQLGASDTPLSPSFLDDVGLYEAYAGPFRDLRYVSDSKQEWREGCLHEWLDTADRLYAVVHPIWWFAVSPSDRDDILRRLHEHD